MRYLRLSLGLSTVQSISQTALFGTPLEIRRRQYRPEIYSSVLDGENVRGRWESPPSYREVMLFFLDVARLFGCFLDVTWNHLSIMGGTDLAKIAKVLS